MRFRKLRIAWSVSWGLLAVLPCVLWVLSYSETDVLQGLPKGMQYTFYSSRGRIFTSIYNKQKRLLSHGFFRSGPIDDEDQIASDNEEFPYGFGKRRITNGRQIIVPHWFISCCFLALSLFSWLPYRFSLRTLLIATTLVGIALGIFVWAVK